ncbi:MAG: helix-turn-helix transcriptional regulator [Longimicrobiales bacterium]
MNRYQLLCATSDVSVSRFDHPPHEAHVDPEEERSSRWAIAFVLSGTFDVVLGRQRVRLQRGSVFLSRPGFTFSCRHHEQYPSDVCLSIGFEPHSAGDFEHVWERTLWAVRRSPTPRLAYVQHGIRDAAAKGDTFQLERWALAALTALEVETGEGMARGHYAARRATLEAVVATCRAIESDPVSRRSVADRARDVGLTSAPLTRAFRRYVGTAPHAYVMRCRLAAAAELLDSGRSVSETCYRSGFENQSHFCRTFQRTFGVRASLWRTLGLEERRRRVRELASHPFQA